MHKVFSCMPPPPPPHKLHRKDMFQETNMQVVRLSSQDVPTAYAYELEAATIVQPEQVVEAVKNVVPKFAVA